MTLVVTGVGLLIHIYSTGYMAHDKGYARYFAYLNLFTFAMLILVLASNLVLMFVGWEGVGLCSYLLIGFWFEKPAAANAGKKAFLVNRDRRRRIPPRASCSCSSPSAAPNSRPSIRPWPAAALAPGHGDARRPASLRRGDRQVRPDPALRLAARRHGGPDPGQRPHPRRDHGHGRRLHGRPAERALHASRARPRTVVALVGAVTAVFAATMALVQNDIKRVLAYSTISQIGYMFLGCGVGAYAAGIFHLMTHAFFKSLLFLAAGSVIHALSGEQDMRRMGGLRQAPPADLPRFPRRRPGHRRRAVPVRVLLQGRHPDRGLRRRAPRLSGRSACWARS